MAIQQMTTQSARIGKLKGALLSYATPVEVLGITGQNEKMPKNNSDTVVFRRWLPYGGVDNKWITGTNVATYASSHQTTEGVTPTADTLTATDITVTLVQYACLYAITDKTYDLYEDDVAEVMKKQAGERMGLVREMIRYGVLKAATNAYFCGGSGIDTTDEAISLNMLRKVARNLMQNHAKQITSVLDASPKFGTSPVEAGFLVFCHSDMEPAIRDLPGFVHVSEYGNRKTVNENELGSVERFRFIISPELAAYVDQGAAVGATGLYTSGTKVDVYPMIVVGEDAWGDVALRGAESFSVSFQAPGQIDKSDPLGQRGFIGAKFYSAATVLNQGFMAVVHSGTPSLA